MEDESSDSDSSDSSDSDSSDSDSSDSDSSDSDSGRSTSFLLISLHTQAQNHTRVQRTELRFFLKMDFFLSNTYFKLFILTNQTVMFLSFC